MGRWVKVAAQVEVPPGAGKTVQVAHRSLAVFNDGGELLAIDDTCPHQGASLGEGTLVDGRVICPWHSWVFELRGGACRGIPELSVGCYPVRVRDGAIEVSLPEG